MNSDRPLEDVLTTAIEESDGDTVTLGGLLDLYEQRTYGPIFTLLGLLVLIPVIGAIPGLPTVVGFLVVVFSVQLLFGRTHIWVPGVMESMSIDKSRLKTAQEKSERVLKFIDGVVTDRLTWATRGASRTIAAVLLTVLGLVLMPAELIPWAAAVPGAAIAMIGLALLSRDGAVMLAAYALALASFWVIYQFMPF